MITAQVEPLEERLEELKPLFPLHWRELALNQDEVPLDPQYDIYEARARAGETLLVTLREAGKIIGYFVGFVAPGLHYKTCLTLTMDIFWLHPEFRASDSLSRIESEMAAEDLFAEVKAEAKRRGVKRMFVGSKMNADASRLFEALGYVECERYYTAWLGD